MDQAGGRKGLSTVSQMKSADTVQFEGEWVTAISPEGIEERMPLPEFLARISPPVWNTAGAVLPDGVRTVFAREPMLVVVHESPPQVIEVEWIREDSPKPYGPGATYRRRRLAFPYQVLFCVFGRQRGRLALTRRNELFFATRSLCAAGLDDEDHLKFPTLLNVSRYEEIDMEGKSLAWLCTQAWGERDLINRVPDEAGRVVRGVDGLVRFLGESKYNLSSEVNPQAKASRELRSWFTESARRKIDPRVQTVAAWERATRKDPSFILQVPFLPVGHSVAAVAERIFNNYCPPAPGTPTAADLARIVFNRKRSAASSHDYPHTIF